MWKREQIRKESQWKCVFVWVVEKRFFKKKKHRTHLVEILYQLEEHLPNAAVSYAQKINLMKDYLLGKKVFFLIEIRVI